MLDNLVESRNNSTNTARRGGYLFTTSVLVFSLFASGIMWSLFAKNLEINGDLELSSMIAPVQMAADEPPAPEPVREVKQNTAVKQTSALPVRQVNMASTSEPIPPKEISTAPVGIKSRPNTTFLIGKTDEDPVGNSSSVSNERINGNAPQVIASKPRETEKSEVDDPPQIVAKKTDPKPEPKEVVKKPAGPVSKGVINGTAVSLPKPPYPAAAKAIHISGDVNVQVTIDEQGNVIAANAVTGHPLLRSVSEQAARSAKFRPTLLSDQPVKVTGIIVYKFSAQ